MTDMVCERCNGRVEWQGPWSELGQHGTRCTVCGARNCQRTEPGPSQNDSTDEEPSP